jgi:hypothetical protein
MTFLIEKKTRFAASIAVVLVGLVSQLSASLSSELNPNEFKKQFENLISSGLEEATKSTSDTGAAMGHVPTKINELIAYLKAGKYKKFSVSDKETYKSRGPHAKFGRPVRVFFDKTIADSLGMKNVSHPAGSSLVKEMYQQDGTTLDGWAVMTKTQDASDKGKGWFWSEILLSDAEPKIVAVGNGVRLCIGCHRRGKDYVLSKLPE